MLVLLLATLAAAVSPNNISATSDPPKQESIGNRELGITFGYGVPTNERLYVNPYGPTFSARFGWALGGPTLRFYVGAEGSLTTGVRRSYFTGSASANLFYAGAEAGIRYYLPKEHMHLGANLGAALGQLTYRSERQNDAENSCLCLSGAVTLGFEITRHVNVGIEAKFTWLASWPRSFSEPMTAFTPSVQSTYRF
ncbi:MAG TPA: hypothetical protein VJ860_08995 [Polyangia bacterium]|jgi:hypothetical protein|nr:hypothetical protein [Polyangia bacterium]